MSPVHKSAPSPAQKEFRGRYHSFVSLEVTKGIEFSTCTSPSPFSDTVHLGPGPGGSESLPVYLQNTLALRFHQTCLLDLAVFAWLQAASSRQTTKGGTQRYVHPGAKRQVSCVQREEDFPEIVE